MTGRGRARARLAAGLVVLLCAGGARADEPLLLGSFAPPADPAAPPPGWEALTFSKVARHTRYTVVRDGAGWVLRADSDASASGLYRPLDLDPKVHRILSWRWKVEGVLARSDPRFKSGDDYAARVYVAFRYDPGTATLWERARYGVYRLLHGRYPPGLAINYVWESRLPVGTVLDSAYTSRTKIVVVRSGAAEAGRWVGETRDVYEDYRRIVGGEPPRIVGVALMTDTDDTKDRAVAYYDAITFSASPGGPRTPDP
ncbi:MAG TPA: DUF3047 domain-containing protein [Candidatus Dormibacteraeota bacterium]|nr:DUF3047 domain-containing protein [Candidatus Dormibacteraeota bacterium]